MPNRKRSRTTSADHDSLRVILSRTARRLRRIAGKRQGTLSRAYREAAKRVDLAA